MAAVSNLRLTRELLAEGYTHNELARQTRSGELQRLRRGVYLAPAEASAEAALQHQRLVEATVRVTAPDGVVSHVSAAVLHRLPVLTEALGRVQLTRPDIRGGKNRGGRHLYATPLDPADVVLIRGVRVTSLARTVVDVSRVLRFDQAVVIGDAALREGLSPADLEACLLRSAGRPGMARARRAVAFFDPRSESPGESLSRVVLHESAVPAPDLQYDVTDSAGRIIGRSDFCWEEQRTLGEFDGKVKYGRLLKPGQTASDVIYQEKLREDEFRDLGWQVVRWCWIDIGTPGVIAERLTRAFARALR